MLNQIQTRMQQALSKEGVNAEITFCRNDMFSVFCEDAVGFCKAKQILEETQAQYDSEDCDPEIGFFAYFRF